MNDISVIGAGKWGEALHLAFLVNNNSVISSRTTRDIVNFIKMQDVFNSEYIVIAIAVQSMNSFLKEYQKELQGKKILVASKGIEACSGKFLNEVFEQYLDPNNIAYLSGPSFATEVKAKLPTAVVINSKNTKLSSSFEKFFPVFMKTYTSEDVIGAEVAGAYKNVLAIASGICDGLKLGNNARASLISRGLVEMARFGKYFGAEYETFLSLSGAGDLFLSASSELSRNYRVGLYLAQGMSIEDILIKLGEVAEGVFTATAIAKLSSNHKIYTPIAKEVNLILNSEKSCQDSLKDLIS